MESFVETCEQLYVAVRSTDIIPNPDFDSVIGAWNKLLPQSKTPSTRNAIGYTVENRTDDYEERCYPASTWVCTTVSSVYQDTAKIEGFRRLQSYAQGHNDKGAFLSIHPPILTRLSTENGDSFDRKFVISTYLCDDHLDGLPRPDNTDVYLEHLPEMTVFVRTFQGIACEEKWTYETKRLAELLRNKEDIRTDIYFTASYESPYQLVSSKSEIWFIKYDRIEDSKCVVKETSVLRYGEQKVEISNVVGLIMYMICGCISILSFLFKLSINSSGYVRDNWGTIKSRAIFTSRVVRRNVSIGTILRTSATLFLAIWSIALELVSGTDAYKKTFPKPKKSS